MHVFDLPVCVYSISPRVSHFAKGLVGGLNSSSEKAKALSTWYVKKLNKQECVLFIAVEYHATVLEAIAEYHKHTCLKFVVRTNEPNWLLFVHKEG